MCLRVWTALFSTLFLLQQVTPLSIPHLSNSISRRGPADTPLIAARDAPRDSPNLCTLNLDQVFDSTDSSNPSLPDHASSELHANPDFGPYKVAVTINNGYVKTTPTEVPQYIDAKLLGPFKIEARRSSGGDIFLIQFRPDGPGTVQWETIQHDASQTPFCHPVKRSKDLKYGGQYVKHWECGFWCLL